MRYFNGVLLFCLAPFFVLVACTPLPSQNKETAEITSLTVDLTVQPIDVWERIRKGYAVPNLNSPLVDKWVAYYAARPEYIQRMADRSGKYLYYIVNEVNRRDLPTELALLPFIESAFDPNALSSAQASGLWQFIPSTGTQFKLEQNWWRDQRRDPIASTHAALDYLEYLFNYQGDWYLAFASYNWGEGSVKRALNQAVKSGKTAQFEHIKLPQETENYIPKLQAIKNIIANPEQYSIVLPAVNNEPYFVSIKKDKDIDLTVAAKLAQMPIEDFTALNPSFNQGVIMADHLTEIILPIEKAPNYLANLAEYEGDLTSWKKYPAQEGESILSIAQKFNVSVDMLRQANDLNRRMRSLPTARNLVIPGATATVATFTIQNDRNFKTQGHQVRSGETLVSIAYRYQISPQALKDINNLKSNKVIVGQKILIPR
jgi:membrane-bound lytic murein transglycosylase D